MIKNYLVDWNIDKGKWDYKELKLEPRVYVAGKYTDSTSEKVKHNVLLAEAYGKIIARDNIKVYVPHLATANWDAINTYDYFFDLHASILKSWATDIFLLPNYKDSSGAIKEKKIAEDIGLKVWFPDQLEAMLEHYK